MRENRLCRERLDRIRNLIDRHGGSLSIRDMSRSYGIQGWEIEEAAAAGWVRIATRKPAVGRPSRFAENVSNTQTAKLPPRRGKIPRDYKMEHWDFAFECGKMKPFPAFNCRIFPAAVRAYLATYPNARSYAGARASASRLMRRPDVQAMLHWFRVKSFRIDSGPCPATLAEFYAAMK